MDRDADSWQVMKNVNNAKAREASLNDSIQELERKIKEKDARIADLLGHVDGEKKRVNGSQEHIHALEDEIMSLRNAVRDAGEREKRLKEDVELLRARYEVLESDTARQAKDRDLRHSEERAEMKARFQEERDEMRAR